MLRRDRVCKRDWEVLPRITKAGARRTAAKKHLKISFASHLQPSVAAMRNPILMRVLAGLWSSIMLTTPAVAGHNPCSWQGPYTEANLPQDAQVEQVSTGRYVTQAEFAALGPSPYEIRNCGEYFEEVVTHYGLGSSRYRGRAKPLLASTPPL
mgnify:CR=1